MPSGPAQESWPLESIPAAQGIVLQGSQMPLTWPFHGLVEAEVAWCILPACGANSGATRPTPWPGQISQIGQIGRESAATQGSGLRLSLYPLQHFSGYTTYGLGVWSGTLRHLIDLDSGDLLDLSASPQGVGPGPDGMGAWKAIFAATGQSAADLDHDGYPDTALANWYNQHVDLHRGQPDGSLKSWKQYTVGARPLDVALHDLNGDGWEDIVVANSESQNLSVLLATGQGKFAASVAVPIAADPRTVEVRVLDRDEHPDLLCLSQAGTLHLLHGDGTGLGYVEEVLWVGGAPTDLVSGDVDGDGRLELLVNHRLLGRFDLFELDPVTGLSLEFSQSLGVPTWSANFGDHEGDGIVDLFVAADNPPNRVLIFSGDGAGGFPQMEIIEGFSAYEATSADLDRDGYQELLLSYPRVTVLERLPDGSYHLPLTWPAPEHLGRFRLADSDGDGRDDLFLVRKIPPSQVSGFWQWEMQASRWPSFEQPILTTALPFTAYGETWDVGDFDGDGRADAACLRYGTLPGGGNGYQLVESHNAGNTFGPWIPVQPYTNLNSLIVEDVNGDGFSDAVLYQGPKYFGAISPHFTICFGGPQGLAGGEKLDLPTRGEVFGIQSGNVTGDSLPDLVVSTLIDPYYPTVSIFPGVAGAARFGAKELLDWRYFENQIVGDLDGDGYDDLLGLQGIPDGPISPWQPIGPLDFVPAVLRGSPTGIAALPMRVDLPGGWNFMQVPFGSVRASPVDLNGDGHPDLLSNESECTIRFGNGQLGFSAPTSFGNYSHGDVAVGDANGDGQPDLLYLEHSMPRFALLVHRP